VSGKPVKKKFYAYPELTPCARYLLSDRPLLPLLFFILLSSAVPWEWLYSREWYRAWIDVAANWSPNIRLLPSSPSRVVELASAYLAFANTLGPFYLAATIRCGWRHGGHPELLERNRNIKNREIARFFAIAVTMVLLMLYGALWWEGESSTLYHTDIFYRSGPAFIAMHACIWWWFGMMFLGLAILARMLIARRFGTYR